VSLPASVTILDLAGAATVTAAQLVDLSAELAELVVPA